MDLRLGEMDETDLACRHLLARLGARLDIAPDFHDEGARGAVAGLGPTVVVPELLAFTEHAGAARLGAGKLGNLVEHATTRAHGPAGMAD